MHGTDIKGVVSPCSHPSPCRTLAPVRNQTPGFAHHARRTVVLSLAFGLALALSPHAEVLVEEPFDYNSGSLVDVSGGGWLTHSGTSGQANVEDQALILTQKDTEDVHLPIPGAPYGTNHPTELWARFVVIVETAPTGAQGSYFAHFKEGLTTFRGRLFVSTNTVEPGQVRFGVATASNQATTWWPEPSALLTPHTIVVRYRVDQPCLTMWLNPATVDSPSIASTDTSAPTRISSFALRQAVSSGNGMGGLRLDDLRIGTASNDVLLSEDPPSAQIHILQSPSSMTVEEGRSIEFKVEAQCPIPLNYQWWHNGVPVPDGTSPALVLGSVSLADAGDYTVSLSDGRQELLSEPATLTVIPALPINSLTIAGLREQMAETGSSTGLVRLEGWVTGVFTSTEANRTRFYLQDPTGGLLIDTPTSAHHATLHRGVALRITGVPSRNQHGQCALQVDFDSPGHSLESINLGKAPPPLHLNQHEVPTETNLLPYEGCLAAVSNVFFASERATFVPWETVTVLDNQEERFRMVIDPQATELTGRPIPSCPVNILGVIVPASMDDPQDLLRILVTSATDLEAFPSLPQLTFNSTLHLVRPGDAATNQFTEQSLRTGDQLRIEIRVDDAYGRPVTFTAPLEGAPATSSWQQESLSPGMLMATFRYEAIAADAGKPFLVQGLAINDDGTNRWEIELYLPTDLEQQIAITEFLSNPTSLTSSPLFNPLRRETPATDPATQDEFVEITNLGPAPVDLIGWSLSDSNQKRHRFSSSTPLMPYQTLIVYGGPTFGNAPTLTQFCVPASAGQDGLGLNNQGGDSIVLRNHGGSIVSRVVYHSTDPAGSLTRHPSADAAFVGHATIAAAPCSPGLDTSGSPFGPLPLPQHPEISVVLNRTGDEHFALAWRATPTHTYTVWSAADIGGPFKATVSGLAFPDTNAVWTIPANGHLPRQYFRVTSP